MAEPRRPQAPARPTAPVKRGAAKGTATTTKSATKSTVSAKRATSAASRHSGEAAGASRVVGQAGRFTQRARDAGRSAGRAARAAGASARADARQSTSRSSSTLSAHRPEPGTAPVPTPWAKVTAGSAAKVTTRMQERLRERRTAHTRLLALRWGKRAVIALGAFAAVWLVLLSPVFAFDAEKLESAGFGSVVDPEQVEAVVSAHDGKALAMLDTGDIAAELEQLVGVREVSITRVWPAGLRVEITSSEPVAAIPQADGSFVLVDDRGEQVDSAKDVPARLPVVTIPLATGETRILDGVLDVIDDLPVNLRDRVEGIEADTEDSIHFVLRDGPRVEWGSGEQSALKAEVLQALLESPEASSAHVIDVSAPSLPITRAE
ncbi:cell division protein FtsQ/DivIB [Demequina sp. SO4-13]|uniref:cell division protein FtsQ/DivIB n=1 Tax=Demequina sp. SO4-13 TaxID=3401027 RepID=UPI003AF5B1A6